MPFLVRAEAVDDGLNNHACWSQQVHVRVGHIATPWAPDPTVKRIPRGNPEPCPAAGG